MASNDWQWPAHLDATVAAPQHHRIAFENDAVRVLETRIEPGETVNLHTHCWPAATYVLSWSHFIRRDEHGEITLNTKEQGFMTEPGKAAWTPILGPHTLENVGDCALHVITVEVKQATS